MALMPCGVNCRQFATDCDTGPRFERLRQPPPNAQSAIATIARFILRLVWGIRSAQARLGGDGRRISGGELKHTRNWRRDGSKMGALTQYQATCRDGVLASGCEQTLARARGRF